MHKQSLAAYIHWPFCKSKCPYCDFNSHVREGVDQDRWKKALLQELEYMASHVPDRQVTSIFFGGGTPSLMPPATAQAVIDRIGALWPMDENVEITLEANPTSVETDTFADFAKAGVNRVSLGVQSLNSVDLKFLGREHSTTEALRAIELARKTFKRYSFDLIYARPGQSLGAWEAELTQAFSYAGKHLSLYQLTIEENTAFHHAVKLGQFSIPGEADAEALYLLTEEMTKARGLNAYEVSNYAAPGEESRHNLSYWQGDDYIGVGPGAHGRLTISKETWSADHASHQHGPMREPAGSQRGQSNVRLATSTLKSPERWLENVEKSGHAVEVWDAVEQRNEIEERVMMGLRLRGGIGYREFKKQTGYDLLPHLNAQKQQLYTEQGLLENKTDRLQATIKGRLLLNSLTAELLG